jgi:ribosomal protein L6P/L9E
LKELEVGGKRERDVHKVTSMEIEDSKTVSKEYLVLNLGLSHPTTYAIPKKDIRLSIRNAQSSDSNASVPKVPRGKEGAQKERGGGKGGLSTNAKTSATISIFGISYFKVRQIAAEITRYKEPEVYSGKGINHDGQKCFLKKKK